MIKKGGKKAVSKGGKRRWKIASAIIIFSLSIVIGLLLWLSYTGSSKEIEAVANQFKPDASWELISERITPPMTFCLDSVECPSIARRWKTETLLTRSEFVETLHRAGWNFEVEGSCVLDNPNRYGDSIGVCSASGVIESYEISVEVSSSNPAEKYSIAYSIKKKE